MAYKTKIKKTLHKEKDFERRLYYIRADGLQFWSAIPPNKNMGEKLIKSKIFKVNKLKEGYNEGNNYFSQGDINSIKDEREQVPYL